MPINLPSQQNVYIKWCMGFKMQILIHLIHINDFDFCNHLHYQVYQSATNDYVYFNKEFGRSVSVSGALEGELLKNNKNNDGKYELIMNFSLSLSIPLYLNSFPLFSFCLPPFISFSLSLIHTLMKSFKSILPGRLPQAQ